jgi:hypothetical protein
VIDPIRHFASLAVRIELGVGEAVASPPESVAGTVGPKLKVGGPCRDEDFQFVSFVGRQYSRYHVEVWFGFDSFVGKHQLGSHGSKMSVPIDTDAGPSARTARSLINI